MLGSRKYRAEVEMQAYDALPEYLRKMLRSTGARVSSEVLGRYRRGDHIADIMHYIARWSK